MSRSPALEQEEKHFTELSLRLIDLVDAKTRAIVADKIAGYPTGASHGPAAAVEGTYRTRKAPEALPTRKRSARR